MLPFFCHLQMRHNTSDSKPNNSIRGHLEFGATKCARTRASERLWRAERPRKHPLTCGRPEIRRCDTAARLNCQQHKPERQRLDRERFGGGRKGRRKATGAKRSGNARPFREIGAGSSGRGHRAVGRVAVAQRTRTQRSLRAIARTAEALGGPHPRSRPRRERRRMLAAWVIPAEPRKSTEGHPLLNDKRPVSANPARTFT